MNEELLNFLNDLIVIFQEKYNNERKKCEELNQEGESVFHQGAIFAYYDVLDIIRLQVEAFGYNLEEIGSIIPENENENEMRD